MKAGNGMCPVCKVVPRNAGGTYCAGCKTALQSQNHHARKRQRTSYTLGTLNTRVKKPPTDWRAVLAASEGKP